MIVVNEIGLKINVIRYIKFSIFSWIILMVDLNRYKFCLYVNEFDVSCVECYLWFIYWYGVFIVICVYYYVIWIRDVIVVDVVMCMCVFF